MRFGYSDACLEHDPGDRHPETPDRLLAIRQGLSRRHGVEYVTASPATLDDVTAIHDAGYIDRVREFCANGGGQWDPDTIAVEETWDAALASAGLAQWAAEEALAGADGRRTPFSLGRPPGHHATLADAMGFCFLNNTAIAAQHVIDADGAERVAIIDWDVHHGNGTQDIFYERGDVLYVSIHERGLYPGTGALDETGVGSGEGTTLNVPFPAGAGDPEYLAAFDDLIVPVTCRFDPDLVLISAGFDAHRHDPISRMRVSTDGYGVFTDRVRTVCSETDAGLGFVLEGGYSLDKLADGVGMVHEVFDGFDPVPSGDEASETIRELIERARELHGVGEK